MSDTVDTVLKERMLANIDEAESIYELALSSQILDTQDFLDWQDRLNAISVK